MWLNYSKKAILSQPKIIRMLEFVTVISQKINISEKSVKAVLQLLEEGSTIPFIARYRKDVTGALDEVQIQQIQDEAKFQKEFSERKAAIEKAITEQGKMTEAIQKALDNATTLTQLEDIYLPYKQKRKTRAQMARDKGLEPLANLLLEQQNINVEDEAKNFINDEVKTFEEAIVGARDIIAENINENAGIRESIRNIFQKEAFIISKVNEETHAEAPKYKDYFEYTELISKIPSHRILAILRGAMEGILRMSIEPEDERVLTFIEKEFIIANNDASAQVKKAIKECYRRLLQPSMEGEFRTAIKQRADEEAIEVFAENLRQLLLSSPLGSKRILAIDPGYRTGCKVVCIDEKGALQKTDLIYIHEKNHKLQEAENTIRNLVYGFKTQAFAIGDGTAGRETQQFIASLKLNIPIFLVNEDGASIYSASEIAREEFPDYDITVRGSVSIGRRLMDPLAELVKIDPKSIGVGQYQHDVNQFRLKEKLDQTVVSCVNSVGVNLNTASKHLLAYVSGIGNSVAENIVAYRNEIGSFSDRKQLLEVPRLGQKVFEQSAGFLRIQHGENPLDKSGVHPEAYKIVEKMAADLSMKIEELIGNEKVINEIKADKYIDEKFGIHTIKDILKELKKPGLDPRPEVQTFEFADIFKIEDVIVGSVVPGQVTNITRFGAFVDIGVKQDGMVHVSEIANRFISDPNEVLKLNDKVMVKVLEVDIPRKRINLSIKQTQEANTSYKKKPTHKVEPKQEQNFDDALMNLKQKFGK